jgi:hypothetical protein
MLANTRKLLPTNHNLTVKNDNVLAQYGITPHGYKNIMNYLENTICRGDSDILSPEELEKLEPYITFARSTLKVTVPENYIEEKQHGGVNYEFENEYDNNNNTNNGDAYNIFNKGRIFNQDGNDLDVFNMYDIFDEGRIFKKVKKVNQINELSNAIARKKLAKIPGERYREELDRDREEWDNSITRRTVYSVLMMAQILNDVDGVRRKISTAMSELQAHDRFCEAHPERFLTKQEYKNTHAKWKHVEHLSPLDTAAALKEYVLKKGGKEAEILLKQLIRTHPEFRPRPAQEIEQEIRDKIRIPSNEVNVAHRYPSAVEEYVTGRWNGMVERIRELHPDATRDTVYSVATKCLYQELNEFSQHHSGEQLAIAPPRFNGQLTSTPSVRDVSLSWSPHNIIDGFTNYISSMFSKSVTPQPVTFTSTPAKSFLPGSTEAVKNLQEVVAKKLALYDRVQGAGEMGYLPGESVFSVFHSTEKGNIVSGRKCAPVSIFVYDVHLTTKENEKCKTPCTKNSRCLNINATKYQTDPTTGNKFPVDTGLIAMAEEISKDTGATMTINLETTISKGFWTIYNYSGGYATSGSNSALMHSVAIGINCVAQPAFEEAIQQGLHTDKPTCLYPGIQFNLNDQRYNNTNIDAMHFIFSNMINSLQREDSGSTGPIIDAFLEIFTSQGMTKDELFSYLRFLYNKNGKMRDLFKHPTFRRYSRTYNQFSTLPEEIQKPTFDYMGNKEISFMFSPPQDSRNKILLDTINQLESYSKTKNHNIVHRYFTDTTSQKYKDLKFSVEDIVVNFQQLMPDLETVRLLMTSGFTVPISQFGALHLSNIKGLLIKEGWFEEVISYKPTAQMKCASRVPSRNPSSASSSSSSKKISMIPQLNLHSMGSNRSNPTNGKSEAAASPNFYSSPSARASGELEAAASHNNSHMLEQAPVRHSEYRLPSSSSSGKLEAAASPNFYSSPSARARGKLEAVMTSPMVQNNNNFQTKLTRHRKEMNEIIERNKRSSESIDPTQFPEKYRAPLGLGRQIVRGLADRIIPGPSYPQAPSYPQLENGWFRRLHTREFKNLTEEEKKYIDSLSWKKMGDLTEEERAYLRYKGIINPYEYSSNPPPMYVLQTKKREEEQKNLIERLEREKASSGITGWLKGMIGRAPPRLHPSRRQKQNPKQGGTRRKQKRTNPTRRKQKRSKPTRRIKR